MQMIRFYKDTWSKKITWKDRSLFGLMLLLITGYYFYSIIFRKYEILGDHLPELFGSIGLIFTIVFIRPIGNFLLKLWFCISGTFGQIVFFIIQFIVFYLILCPVYMVVNLTRKKNISKDSNWSADPNRNTNYKNPG
jgi:hypothetical protein